MTAIPELPNHAFPVDELRAFFGTFKGQPRVHVAQVDASFPVLRAEPVAWGTRIEGNHAVIFASPADIGVEFVKRGNKIRASVGVVDDANRLRAPEQNGRRSRILVDGVKQVVFLSHLNRLVLEGDTLTGKNAGQKTGVKIDLPHGDIEQNLEMKGLLRASQK